MTATSPGVPGGLEGELGPLLDHAWAALTDHLAGLGGRPVRASAGVTGLRAALGVPLGDAGEPAEAVLGALVEAARSGTVATAGPRYFGFVTGGSLPVATAVELLAVGWDQNAAMAVMSPLASV